MRKKLYLRKYDRFKTYTGGTFKSFDKETLLPLGVDSDFDAFIDSYKKRNLVGEKDKNEYKSLILSLVHKFKTKSEPELIRLFRISLANMKKKSLVDKMRGAVMEESLMKTASLMRNYDRMDQRDENFSAELEEEEFEKHLVLF